jgi:hypothetical protein
MLSECPKPKIFTNCVRLVTILLARSAECGSYVFERVLALDVSPSLLARAEEVIE